MDNTSSNKSHKSQSSLIKQSAFYISIIIFILFMISCATTKQGKTMLSIPTHGNFCGPGQPPVNNSTKIENVIELMTIKPFDDIDVICQRHDICYEVTGYFNQKCDAWLASEIGKLNFDQKGTKNKLHCKNIQYGIISSWGIASSRTRTTKTGDPLKDASNGMSNYLAHQVTGYIAAGFMITIDAAANKLDHAIGTPRKCNQFTKSNKKSGYDPKIVSFLFNDSLIELMKNKKYIDNSETTKLRNNLGIDTASSYFQRWGKNFNIKQWKDHPVLSGDWVLNPD